MKSSSLTRRSFLKHAAIAGAAPLLLRSGLRAETPANSRIALGFIGVGTQGKNLMRGFLPRDDVKVLAVCDPDTDRRNHARQMVETAYAADTTAGTYKGCVAYKDFEELLARPDIDAVVIATPDHWHALTAIAAARAGKDIYCEKPMAHTIHEGRAMVDAVRSNNRIFQVGSMQRSSTEFRVACELVRNGVLGTVRKADVFVGNPSMPCNLPAEANQPGLDWNRWLGPAPFRPYNSILSPRGVHTNFPEWRSYREYGGGGVSDWGAHHFDIVQWGCGFDNTGPVEVLAAPQPDAVEGVRLRYANGMEVTHRAGNGIMFYGDKGKLWVNRGQFHLWIGDQSKTEDVREAPQIAKELLPENAVRLYHSDNHAGDWVNSMRTRRLPICDVETGHRTASVCCLVNIAYAHHQNLKWDPDHEKFLDHSGQAIWLTREYRTPWKVS